MDSMMMPNHRSYTIEPCRLCCIYNYHKTDILGEPPHMAANDDLCAKIFRCVAIHVTRKDKSTKICDICYDKINEIENYRDLCAMTNIQMTDAESDDEMQSVDEGDELHTLHEINTEGSITDDRIASVDAEGAYVASPSPTPPITFEIKLEEPLIPDLDEAHPCSYSLSYQNVPEYTANENDEYCEEPAISTHNQKMIKTEESVHEEYWEYDYDDYTEPDFDVARNVSEMATEATHSGIDVRYEKWPSPSAVANRFSSDDETECDVQIVGAYTLGIDDKNDAVINKWPSKLKKEKKGKREKVKGKARVKFTIKCKYCSAMFDCVDAMRYHIPRYHAKGIRKTISCYLCKKNFIQKTSLPEHMKKKHTGHALLICPFPMCTHAYTKQFQLNAHINSKHTKQIAYKCSKCDEKFYDKGLRQYHEKTRHSKRFTCKWCKRSYVSKEYIKIHVQKVHMAKPRK